MKAPNQSISRVARFVVALFAMSMSVATAQAPPVILEDEYTENVIGAIERKFTRQGHTLAFTIAATTAPDPNVRVVADDLPPGAAFTQLPDGYGVFSWTPVTGQEGEYRPVFSEENFTKSTSGGGQEALILVAGYPLSHGFYRIPYGDGEPIFVSRDHVNHTPPVKEDWVAQNGGANQNIAVVAAADGRIRSIVDHNTACCGDSDNGVNCSACNNSVWIEHSNGEWTKYSHFKTGTVTGSPAFLDTNDCVVEGQILGYEGDVGHTGGNDRLQTVCSTPLVDTTRRCGIHLHWEVRWNQDDDFLRVPILCNVLGQIAYSGDVITADDCDGIGCVGNVILGAQVIGGDAITVYKATTNIDSEQELIGSTSTAYFAGNSVTLEPGFAARSGTYFHAMIKPCEGGPTGCPPE